MNSGSDDAVTNCWYCNKRPATTRYTNRSGKLSELVCDPCLDLLQMQEAFEWGIVDTFKLEDEERYDEILAWLDAFEEAHRHRDQGGWLKRSVAGHRQLVLWQAGRYDEALEACDVIEQLGFRDITDRWALAASRARNYEGLERHAEALAVFEAAFREQDPRYLAGARYWMRLLPEFSENAGKPVDESWREVVQNVADEFEVEVPVRPTLGETILALFELTEGKPSKRQRESQKKQAAEEGSSGDKANDPPK
jgi:tetratricopeptide (TPR) repeat protein